MPWGRGITWYEKKEWEIKRWWLYYHDDIFSRFLCIVAYLLGFGYWLVISYFFVNLFS